MCRFIRATRSRARSTATGGRGRSGRSAPRPAARGAADGERPTQRRSLTTHRRATTATRCTFLRSIVPPPTGTECLPLNDCTASLAIKTNSTNQNQNQLGLEKKCGKANLASVSQPLRRVRHLHAVEAQDRRRARRPLRQGVQGRVQRGPLLPVLRVPGPAGTPGHAWQPRPARPPGAQGAAGLPGRRRQGRPSRPAGTPRGEGSQGSPGHTRTAGSHRSCRA